MMPTNEEEYIYIASLIRKQLHAELSVSERAQLDTWLARSERNRQIYEDCQSVEGRMAAFQVLDALDSDEAYARIKPLLSQTPSDDHRLTPGRSRGRYINKWWPYAAAAVAIMILTVGILQLTIFQPSPIHTPPQTVDFAPASHKAIITLSDGRNFELDTEQDKIYFTEDGIAYADGATLATTESSSYATISTPRGGTYQLILADGTSVTLNAASSLTYPTEFIGPTRHVKLEGEAFFDVSARPRPFLVETRSHTVEVLGTRFNVSAYEEEQQAGTTLVEGSVRLTAAGSAGKAIELQPGQHGMVANGEINASEANLAAELAWYDGRFNFDGKKLREVMRELSRWYDVDIQYEGEVPDIEFFGGTFRNSSLATILTLLENTGIAYRLEADRKVVLRNKG